MKILLAVDGSPTTKRMLAYVAARDELLGPGHSYTAVTVVPPIPAHAAGYLPRDVVEQYHAEQTEAVLAPVRAFAKQQGWTLETLGVTGHAGDTIAELADAGGYDLLVMGTHGHGSLAGLAMGSVTTRVIARSKLPVLLVR